MGDREELFTGYFDSIFASSNLLTPLGYENYAREFDSYYSRFLPERKDSLILDIGCGTGQFLYYLKKKGFENYQGIDVSYSQIEFCKNNVTPNVEVANTFEFLEDKINTYDMISANDVIEHMPKDTIINFLELIYQALKPGGMLLLKLPNMSNPFALNARYRDFTHECGFTEKSIYQVLYVAGFRNINIYPSLTHDRSIKGLIGKILISIFHRVLRKLFWHQGFTAPEILSSCLVVMAKK
ncbi:MAG: class I SAM-dependent methyltransferase [Deltaproteobacteria bacterium]|nr:class I SAM-dependent methyltransferase [Deltaproteobacteria bacterium]